MITISKSLKQINLATTDYIPDEKQLFFDIETTGFSSKNNIVYLIGCIFYRENQFHITQWLAEKESDESLIIMSFYNFIQDFSTIIHFNGNGFDIPFLKSRANLRQIPLDFSFMKNIDIYKSIQPYKKHLKLVDLKQKTIEQFLEIKRDDTKNGGELISVFYDFKENHHEEDKELLLLHNEDDIKGMVQLLPIFSYIELFSGNIYNPKFELNQYINVRGEQKQEAIFSFETDKRLPKRISCGHNDIYMSAHKTSGKIKIEITKQELKYFFPNYQDYYYLPNEDTSIHKSVAFYVDKNFRTKAKAANCYSKKTGLFLPQNEEIIKPFFKKDYHDKQTFFEINDDFCNDEEKITKYVKYLLKNLV